MLIIITLKTILNSDGNLFSNIQTLPHFWTFGSYTHACMYTCMYEHMHAYFDSIQKSYLYIIAKECFGSQFCMWLVELTLSDLMLQSPSPPGFLDYPVCLPKHEGP